MGFVYNFYIYIYIENKNARASNQRQRVFGRDSGVLMLNYHSPHRCEEPVTLLADIIHNLESQITWMKSTFFARSLCIAIKACI